jgi:diguanylate cyclase (GGDEF)-like protein
MGTGLKSIGLRGRQVLLVLLVAFPLVIVIAVESRAIGNMKAAAVFEEASVLAFKVGNYPKEILPDPRTYLSHFTTFNEVNHKGDCLRFVNAELKLHPYFTTLSAIDPLGERVCPANSDTEKNNLADRDYFQRVLEARTYTISGLIHGRLSKKMSIVFAQPALDEQGRVKGVFILGLDVRWLSQALNDALSSMRLPEGTVAVVVDKDGRMVARAPYLADVIGRPVTGWDSAQQLLGKNPNLAREEAWKDGVRRATVYAPMFDSPNGSLWIRVGIPIEPTLKEISQDNLRHGIFVASVVLAALMLAWIISERLVLRPIRALSAAAEALSQESRSIRIGKIAGIAELGRLAEVFDSMAARIEDKRERLKFLALNDGLTGLPNRHSIVTCLAQAIQSSKAGGKTAGIVLLGLDGFKSINDSLGRELGDMVLMKVAKVLADAIGSSAMLGRVGGDEFAVVVTETEDSTAMTGLAMMLKEKMHCPISVGAHQFFISASIGIAVFPEHGSNAEQLLQNADAAMCRAKAQKAVGYCLYDPAMNDLSLARLQMQNLLSQAVAARELSVHYQPKVEIPSGRVTGAEALVRWHSAVLGFVSPGDFIPLAEQTGLILEIGEWVLQSACAQLKNWNEQVDAHFTIAVNLSPRQFTDPDLVPKIATILDRHGVQPHRLELEITEGALMHNPKEAIDALNALRALGMKISVDDFGTGYSSLAYLKHLPIDALKIDKTFVDGIVGDNCDRAIVNAVVNIANERALRVTAEGVESTDQLSIVRMIGCHEYQGYLFSRPLAAPDFLALLRQPAPGA